MKRVIVFATNDYADTPYRSWFTQMDIQFHFLCTHEFAKSYSRFGPHSIIEQGSISYPEEVINALKAFKADVIFARNERDVLPAAALRELLGIYGQSIDSALAYRNKFVMKSHLAKSTVALPEYLMLKSELDIETIPFKMPWVFKPLDESGSTGVAIIRNEQELKTWKRTHSTYPILSESYVEGSMYHVDGLAMDGKVLWSHVGRYLQGCLSYRVDSYAGSISLEQNSEIASILNDESAKVVASLPLGTIHTFHAEFFVTDNGRCIFCEIASRTPGARIKQFTQISTGIDLDRLSLELMLGHSVHLTKQAATPIGWIITYPKKAKLLSIEEGLIHESIVSEQLHGTYGTIYHGGQKSGRGIWSCIFKAESFDQLEPIAKEIYQSIQLKTIWEYDDKNHHNAKGETWSL